LNDPETTVVVIGGGLIATNGVASSWLFALGPVTRPAWWEITATPEIVVQVDRLVARFAAPTPLETPATRLTAEAFLDIGVGI
jgi:uncharacterized NAD(P)/FAD-binding protein YdhS